MAQVAGERLGWPIEEVEVVAGDSWSVAGQAPTGGCRTAVEVGNAMALAARDALAERAGKLLEAAAADVEVSPAGAWVRGSPAQRELLRSAAPAEPTAPAAAGTGPAADRSPA